MWIKVDANLDDHPKALEAGFWGVVAVQIIWRIAKRHGKRGILGPEYVTRRHLRHVTRCDDDDSAKLEAGILAAFESGFLRRLEDGRVECVNWPDHQEDPKHAERQAKYRAARLASRDGSDGGDAACASRDEVTTTGRDVTGRDVTKKEDQDSGASAAPSAPRSSKGRATWITPYLEAYTSALNDALEKVGKGRVAEAVAVNGAGVKALVGYLGKLPKRPTVEEFKARAEEFIADPYNAERGLGLESFPKWHGRKMRAFTPGASRLDEEFG